MHLKWFYYKNVLEMILFSKCIGDDFIIKRLRKLFYYQKVLEMIL